MIYLLYYDTDDGGSREEWNTFHTPVEVFSTPEKREARKNVLKNAVDDDGDPCNWHFYEIDVEVDVT